MIENTDKELYTYEEVALILGFTEKDTKSDSPTFGQMLPNLPRFKRFLKFSGLEYVKLTERVRRIRKIDLDEYVASHSYKMQR